MERWTAEKTDNYLFCSRGDGSFTETGCQTGKEESAKGRIITQGDFVFCHQSEGFTVIIFTDERQREKDMVRDRLPLRAKKQKFQFRKRLKYIFSVKTAKRVF